MKFTVRIYTDEEYPPREIAAVMLRESLLAVTNRIREGFDGGAVRTMTGRIIGEWQYSPTD